MLPSSGDGMEKSEGRARRARGSGMDYQTLGGGPDKQVPPTGGPHKQVPPNAKPGTLVIPTEGPSCSRKVPDTVRIPRQIGLKASTAESASSRRP